MFRIRIDFIGRGPDVVVCVAVVDFNVVPSDIVVGTWFVVKMAVEVILSVVVGKLDVTVVISVLEVDWDSEVDDAVVNVEVSFVDDSVVSIPVALVVVLLVDDVSIVVLIVVIVLAVLVIVVGSFVVFLVVLSVIL